MHAGQVDRDTVDFRDSSISRVRFLEKFSMLANHCFRLSRSRRVTESSVFYKYLKSRYNVLVFLATGMQITRSAVSGCSKGCRLTLPAYLGADAALGSVSTELQSCVAALSC